MGWRDWFKQKQDPKLEQLEARLEAIQKDLKLSIEGQSIRSEAINEAIKERRRTLQKPLQYKTPTSSTISPDRKDVGYIYYGPGYDLSEIGRAIDVEPYVNQSVRKHREQILKEGYRINGPDDDIVDYIKKRLFEMSLVSGITTMQWLREFTTNLVAYGTSFLVIKRDPERSSGRTIRMYGKDRDPIAAIYPMDPTCVTVALNDHGHPVKWKQKINNAIGEKNELIFDADDVIVATIDKKAGFVFGSPYILPTLDDVRSLRRTEEVAELLAQRNAFPLFHFRVGTEEHPAVVFDDGTSELALVRSLVENMPREGGLVTSSRVASETLGGEKQTLDLVPYLEYFEARVLGGLRLSEVDLGRGNTSKASAVTVSQGLEDSARDFQAVITDTLTNYLLLPLCLEGGFDIDPKESMASWEFTMINREEDRAHQAHGNDMFLAGSITHDEFRKEYLGKKPVSDEEAAKLHPNMEHERNKEIQNIAGEQAIAKAKVSKSTAVKNKSANKTRPRNQHGRKASKTRVTKNSADVFKGLYSSMQIDVLNSARAGMWDIFESHKTGVASEDSMNLSTKEEQIQAVFDGYIAVSLIEARKTLDHIMVSGAKDAMEDLELEGEPGISKKHLDRFYKNYVEKGLRNLCNNGIKLINEDNALSGVNPEKPLAFYVNAIFDHLKNDLISLCHKQIQTAYKVGYARTARSHGCTSVTLLLDEDGSYCDECDEAGDRTISLVDKNGSYASLLETHKDCDFVISIGEKE